MSPWPSGWPACAERRGEPGGAGPRQAGAAGGRRLASPVRTGGWPRARQGCRRTGRSKAAGAGSGKARGRGGRQPMDVMPRWADAILVPLINLILAFAISGLVILAIGEDPVAALQMMVSGAFGSTYGWGYTLYYATNFIFTGLAFAVAFHASLFNIGAEGQATLGGLGVALVCLMLPWPHWALALPAAMIGGALFGAAWAFLPGWLQARRGSHIVITTIMFNFIASALLVYLLVNVLKVPGSMAPETARFPEGAHLPTAHDFAGWLGFSRSAPLNVAFFVALACAWLVWLLIWRTRIGYEIRAFGQ